MNSPASGATISLLFVCTHNAGRSALGAALARALSAGHLVVESAGIAPQAEASPVTIASLAEIGIDDSGHTPSALTLERVENADVVVAMRAGLPIPHVPGVRFETWSLPDPSGWDIDGIRPLRDEIGQRVAKLVSELTKGLDDQ